METPSLEHDSIAENDSDLNLNISSDHVYDLNSQPLEPQTENISQKQPSPLASSAIKKKCISNKCISITVIGFVERT